MKLRIRITLFFLSIASTASHAEETICNTGIIVSDPTDCSNPIFADISELLGVPVYENDYNGGPMPLWYFKEKSEEAKKPEYRCLKRSARICDLNIDAAFERNKIDKNTYEWAKKNRFYPTIDENNSIQTVCQCQS